MGGIANRGSEMFEMMKAKVTDYQETGFEVLVMGDFNVHIELGAEKSPNRNGRKLLDLVGVCNLREEYQLSQCSGGVSGRLYPVKGLVVDRMMVEDSGELNLGSDPYLIWCEVRTGRFKEGTSAPCLKWKVMARFSD